MEKKPETCTNHGKGCRSKTNGVVPNFKQNKNGSWQVTCLACQAYHREFARKKREENKARMEAEKEGSSGANDGPPTHCSNETCGRCVSKNQGFVPKFAQMKNGKWYKNCDRCRTKHHESCKNNRNWHIREAKKQGKLYCMQCHMYLDPDAFDSNTKGEYKSRCTKCLLDQNSNITRQIQMYKDDADQDGKPRSLTNAQYESAMKSPCFFCGLEIGMYDRNGIDRIDSKIGYHVHNIVPCCDRCNKNIKKSKDPLSTIEQCIHIASIQSKNETYARYPSSFGDGARVGTLQSYQDRAKDKKIACELVQTDIQELRELPCTHCGRVGMATTWDRVDNKVGYVKSNLVPSCHTCNMARRDMIIEDFYALTNAIARNTSELKLAFVRMLNIERQYKPVIKRDMAERQHPLETEQPIQYLCMVHQIRIDQMFVIFQVLHFCKWVLEQRKSESATTPFSLQCSVEETERSTPNTVSSIGCTSASSVA